MSRKPTLNEFLTDLFLRRRASLSSTQFSIFSRVRLAWNKLSEKESSGLYQSEGKLHLDFLELPDDEDQMDLIEIHLEPRRGKDFKIISQKPLEVTGGWIGLPFSMFAQISDLVIKEGGAVVSPSFYRIYRSRMTGALFVKFDIGAAEAVDVEVSFESLSVASARPPILERIRWECVVEEMEVSGFSRIVQAFRSSKSPLEIYDVARIFSENSIYAESESSPSSPGSFDGFKGFLNDQGVLEAQCDGGNLLLAHFLRRYYEDQPDYRVMNRCGLPRNSRGFYSKPYHARTYLYHRGTLVAILDGTPQQRLGQALRNRLTQARTAFLNSDLPDFFELKPEELPSLVSLETDREFMGLNSDKKRWRDAYEKLLKKWRDHKAVRAHFKTHKEAGDLLRQSHLLLRDFRSASQMHESVLALRKRAELYLTPSAPQPYQSREIVALLFETIDWLEIQSCSLKLQSMGLRGRDVFDPSHEPRSK